MPPFPSVPSLYHLDMYTASILAAHITVFVALRDCLGLLCFAEYFMRGV